MTYINSYMNIILSVLSKLIFNKYVAIGLIVLSALGIYHFRVEYLKSEIKEHQDTISKLEQKINIFEDLNSTLHKTIEIKESNYDFQISELKKLLILKPKVITETKVQKIVINKEKNPNCELKLTDLNNTNLSDIYLNIGRYKKDENIKTRKKY
jgi:hypothetical protein|nr:MAG TPA: hypothetical protein [Caudoviricetes sp.]